MLRKKCFHHARPHQHHRQAANEEEPFMHGPAHVAIFSPTQQQARQVEPCLPGDQDGRNLERSMRQQPGSHEEAKALLRVTNRNCAKQHAIFEQSSAVPMPNVTPSAAASSATCMLCVISAAENAASICAEFE